MLSHLTECPDCEGTGSIYIGLWPGQTTQLKCPRCKGKGYVDEVFDLPAGDFYPAEEF